MKEEFTWVIPIVFTWHIQAVIALTAILEHPGTKIVSVGNHVTLRQKLRKIGSNESSNGGISD